MVVGFFVYVYVCVCVCGGGGGGGLFKSFCIHSTAPDRNTYNCVKSKTVISDRIRL